MADRIISWYVANRSRRRCNNLSQKWFLRDARIRVDRVGSVAERRVCCRCLAARPPPCRYRALVATPPESVDVPEFWLGLGRLPVGALGFALTAVFYIRWTDQWFRQHANQEFRLQQLALDVDRAGYATEMLMEWQEDKAGEMPAVMVDRLTAGLFTDQTTPPRVRHPSEDATAAILKAASRVQIDLPGLGEVTLTGRQVRGLHKKLGRQGEE